jgi:hypothetical protein
VTSAFLEQRQSSPRSIATSLGAHSRSPAIDTSVIIPAQQLIIERTVRASQVT